MSHNINQVGPNHQNRESEISSVKFGPGSKIIIGQSSTDNYSNSPATSLDNSTLYFYDANPVNEIDGASINSSSGWIDEITLPASKYLIKVGFNVSFSSSGQFAFQIYDGSNLIGNRAQIGATAQFANESSMGLASAMISIDSPTTFSVKSPSGNTNLDSIANQGTTPSEFSFLRVERL